MRWLVRWHRRRSGDGLYCCQVFIGQRGAPINADTTARAIAQAASDAKAANVAVLAIGTLTSFADFFVLCTADNERHLRAIQRDIDEVMSSQGIEPTSVEGTSATGWVLMDYSDVIVHILGKTERDYYNLDQLWSAAQPVLVIQ